ncbi:methyltransferase domain-containing protein [Cellulomonas sp. JZ18]|uniref:class I SAM-dependent methyltransferase n=1 Tax=Cellulomonas sp. JZ18 TaxID=2654191 RepID=UPI0012D49F74|nr:class I SAM-dependent methyltransferase [Cellulomonas sp. JZ18]QGQ18802.1 methyltransferase domain-containing protein [Cellulomonas sp. JZ18]
MTDDQDVRADLLPGVPTPPPPPAHPRGRAAAPPTDAAEWDARYGGAERVWSGEPNGALVHEVRGLRPGRALDVGCGEGADAVWLAGHGWDVTALDVSGVALSRARAHATAAGAAVTWVHGGLLDAALPAGAFDLVSAQYPALRRTPDARAERALVRLVAPGGTLLVVHHDTRHGSGEHGGGEHGGFDPDDWVLPRDVAPLLTAGWLVEVDEVRERAVRGGAGAHHTHDVVLRARRLGGG